MLGDNTVRAAAARNPVQPRKRTYSWKGERSPYEKKKKATNDPSQILPVIGREARAVSVHVVGAASIQVIVSLLIRVASYAYPLNSMNSASVSAFWWQEWIMVVPSVLAGCLLRIVPPQVVNDTAPGFIFVSAW